MSLFAGPLGAGAEGGLAWRGGVASEFGAVESSTLLLGGELSSPKKSSSACVPRNVSVGAGAVCWVLSRPVFFGLGELGKVAGSARRGRPRRVFEECLEMSGEVRGVVFMPERKLRVEQFSDRGVEGFVGRTFA